MSLVTCKLTAPLLRQATYNRSNTSDVRLLSPRLVLRRALVLLRLVTLRGRTTTNGVGAAVSIYAQGGTLILLRCVVARNSALDGGAIAVHHVAESAAAGGLVPLHVVMEESVLAGNSASRHGGALYAVSQAASAGWPGWPRVGGLQVRISGCRFHGNAAAQGGALFVADARVAVTHCEIDTRAEIDLANTTQFAVTGYSAALQPLLPDSAGWATAGTGAALYLLRTDPLSSLHASGMAHATSPAAPVALAASNSPALCDAERGVSARLGLCTDRGQGCRVAASSTWCEICPSGLHSRPGAAICSACPSGKGPTTDGGGCDVCTTGHVSVGGVCVLCGAGLMPDKEHKSCVACGQSQWARPDGAGCSFCGRGTQLRSAHAVGRSPLGCEACGSLARADRDSLISADGIVCVVCPAGTRPNGTRAGCNACPPRYAGVGGACAECPGGSQPNAQRTGCVHCNRTSAGRRGECTPCAAGYVQRAGRLECYRCDALPRAVAITGATACSFCGAGTERNAMASACLTCNVSRGEGWVSPSGSTCTRCTNGSITNQ